MFIIDNCDKPYVKHQLWQTDEINTDAHEGIEEVGVLNGAVSDFVAIRCDNDWFIGKFKNLYVYLFP